MNHQRTREVWAYISEQYAHDRNPGIGEIGMAVNNPNPELIRDDLETLTQLGYLAWKGYRGRTMRLKVPLMPEMKRRRHG